MSGLSKALGFAWAAWIVWGLAFSYFFFDTKNIASAFMGASMSTMIIGIVIAVVAAFGITVLGGARGSITILLHFALGAFCAVVGIAATASHGDVVVLVATSFAIVFVSFIAAVTLGDVVVNEEESSTTIVCVFLPFGIGLVIGEMLRRRRRGRMQKSWHPQRAGKWI